MRAYALQVLLHLRAMRWPMLAIAVSWLIAACMGSHMLWQQKTLDDLTNQISDLRASLKTSSAPHLLQPAEVSPEQAFKSALGDPAQLEEYLRILFTNAEKQGVTLSQGNYKKTHSAAGNFDVYTIDLPVNGRYREIRKLSEQVLLALPFSALEEVRFKREHVGSPTLESQLRFVLFLKPSPIHSIEENRGPVVRSEDKAAKQEGGRM